MTSRKPAPFARAETSRLYGVLYFPNSVFRELSILSLEMLSCCRCSIDCSVYFPIFAQVSLTYAVALRLRLVPGCRSSASTTDLLAVAVAPIPVLSMVGSATSAFLNQKYRYKLVFISTRYSKPHFQLARTRGLATRVLDIRYYYITSRNPFTNGSVIWFYFLDMLQL